MDRRWLVAAAFVLCTASLVRSARATGPEYPAGGTRGLGRGAAAFGRADDPSVMARNPALLAELSDHQIVLGANLLLVDSCFQPTGAYGLNVGDDVSDFGDGPVLITADDNDTDLDGDPLALGYRDDPYPEVCYEGPAPFLPHVGIAMKITEDLGLGLGFFPPDNSGLSQWGNRDGTIDTPEGKRPNPLRFLRSHLNTTFFTLMGAAGYRLAPWLSVGAGLQWNGVVYSARTWTTPLANTINPSSNVRSDVFGRDLFVPAFLLSLNVRPIEALEIGAGFKWTDRIRSRAKLDITTNAFGTGEVFEYRDGDLDEEIVTLGGTIPSTFHNRRGAVSSPPFSVPQVTLSVRYADRLVPRASDLPAARVAASGAVMDSLATERFDIELDAIYAFTSSYDRALFRDLSYGEPDTEPIVLRNINAQGIVNELETYAGKCYELDANDECVGKPEVRTLFGGKDQISLRLGSDYNLLPGLLALRAGLSYETDGQDPETLNVLNYMLGRYGLHAGFTVRLAGKTDVSFGFAHFIQRELRLQVDPESNYPRLYKSAEYHFAAGEGIRDRDETPGSENGGDFDGTGAIEIPNGDKTRLRPGPLYVNAGSFFYHLDVFSVSVTQHF